MIAPETSSRTVRLSASLGQRLLEEPKAYGNEKQRIANECEKHVDERELALVSDPPADPRFERDWRSVPKRCQNKATDAADEEC